MLYLPRMEQRMKRIKKGGFEGGAYLDTGTGFPLVLVHGFPADHRLWAHQIRQLQEQYRLICPDLPGTGSSPLAEPLKIADMARFILAILDQENIASCIVIGHSMGGYATLALAEQQPERLAGWGLFHSSAYADDETRKIGRKRSIEMMKTYGQEGFLRQMLPTLFSAAFRKAHRTAVESLIQERVAAGIDALIPYYHAMWERPDRTQVLRDARVPVLFVIGKEDVAAPMDRVLEQVHLPPVSTVHLLADTGHLGMLEKPDTATQILAQFSAFCLQGRQD